MKINIIYLTRTNNTKRVIDAMESVLKIRHEVKIIPVKNATVDYINRSDVIGFASGIIAGNLEKPLREFVESLPNTNKKAIIVSTSADGKLKNHAKFRKQLTEKGFSVINEFNCQGFTKWGPFLLVGGIAKGHPNEQDLEKAKNFAESIF